MVRCHGLESIVFGPFLELDGGCHVWRHPKTFPVAVKVILEMLLKLIDLHIVVPMTSLQQVRRVSDDLGEARSLVMQLSILTVVLSRMLFKLVGLTLIAMCLLLVNVMKVRSRSSPQLLVLQRRSVLLLLLLVLTFL